MEPYELQIDRMCYTDVFQQISEVPLKSQSNIVSILNYNMLTTYSHLEKIKWEEVINYNPVISSKFYLS